MNRDELIAAILPELGKVPMVDAPQSRIREIQAGWIADAILSRLQPSGDGEEASRVAELELANAKLRTNIRRLLDYADLTPQFAIDSAMEALGRDGEG